MILVYNYKCGSEKRLHDAAAELPQRALATVGAKERKEKHNNYDLTHGEYHNKRVPAVLQVIHEHANAPCDCIVQLVHTRAESRMIYFFIADLIRGDKVYVIPIVAHLLYVLSTYICLGEHAYTYLPDSHATSIRLIIFTLVDHALRRVLTAINTSSSSSGRTPSLVFLWVLLDSIQDNWLKQN